MKNHLITRATGAPLNRLDGVQKVTGAAKYAYEYPVEGVTYVFPVQSTIARGRISSIETSRHSNLDDVRQLQFLQIGFAVSEPFKHPCIGKPYTHAQTGIASQSGSSRISPWDRCLSYPPTNGLSSINDLRSTPKRSPAPVSLRPSIAPY